VGVRPRRTRIVAPRLGTLTARATPYRRAIASVLADALLAEGPWTKAGLAKRARLAFGRDDPSWPKLAKATVERYPARDATSSRLAAGSR